MKCVRQFEGEPRKYNPAEDCDPYEKFKAHMQWVDDHYGEFCVHCGAGIGKHRREGEGTCPECDDMSREEWDELGTLAKELWCPPPKGYWHGFFFGIAVTLLIAFAYFVYRGFNP